MEQQLSLHLKKFNEKIKAMNQTNAKELVLTPTDARNIHSDLLHYLLKSTTLLTYKKKIIKQ